MASDIPEFVWLGKFNEKVEQVKAGTSSANQSQPGGSLAGNTQSAQTGTGLAGDTPNVCDVEIEGYAFTLNAVAALMIKLMQSDYFDNVELVKSEENKFGDDEKAYIFNLSARAHFLSDEDLRNLAVQAEREAASASTPQNPKGLN
jgi:hypothetical protein